ncbi:right-handed parallel beta-helix repeat-containing protein [Chloroflexi bacterium TSY]|nr:right-handed parallel beta-helix repeat-containing protein [Chloroflexi bacterium TSY]
MLNKPTIQTAFAAPYSILLCSLLLTPLLLGVNLSLPPSQQTQVSEQGGDEIFLPLIIGRDQTQSTGHLAGPDSYLSSPLLPECTGDDVDILETDQEWQSKINEPTIRVFCLQPGLYSAADLTMSGSSTVPRVIRSYTESGGTAEPWTLKDQEQVVIQGLTIDSAYWIIDGVVLRGDGTPSNLNLVEVNSDGNHIIFNNILAENQMDLIVFKDQSDHNTVQNSVLRNTDLMIPGQDTVCIRLQESDNIRILNNEIYNCTEGLQTNPSKETVLEGLVVEENEIYITDALYADCTTGIQTPNGSCACAENAIDLKMGAASDGTPSIIRGNIFHGFRETAPQCGGSGSRGQALVLQGDEGDVSDVLIECNVIFNTAIGLSFQSDGPTQITLRNNLFSDIGHYTAGAHPSEPDTDGRILQINTDVSAIEIYNNTFHSSANVDVEYLRTNIQPDNLDIRNNLFVDVYRFGSFDLNATTTMCYNGFYNSDQKIVGLSCPLDEDQMAANAQEAKLAEDYCVTIHKWTNPTEHCIRNVVPSTESPVVDAGDRAVGSRPLLGVDDRQGILFDLRGNLRRGIADLGAFEAVANPK